MMVSNIEGLDLLVNARIRNENKIADRTSTQHSPG